MQRLDLKSLRYDRLGKSVLIDGRKVVLEISHEALETLSNRALSEDEAIRKVADEQKRLTRLAEWVPADDGKIHITTNMLMNDGRFETEN
ncbi:MAG: hypothetical protein QNJ29_05095 [Rhizobiaceae bacterium]|nr:hypothetical protein [Rhizobiaceae bacterium]